MPKTKWFRFLYSVVLILVIINLAVHVPFIFYPLQVAISTLGPIVIIGGILFYIFRPLVRLLEKKMPRVVAILLIFAAFTGLVAGFFTWIGPLIFQQVKTLIDNFPAFISEVRIWVDMALASDWWEFVQEQDFLPDFNADTITDMLQGVVGRLGANLLSFGGFVVNAVTALVVVPFVLFFLLKDGDKLPDSLLRFLPQDSRGEGGKILEDMDENLSAYIQGQAIVSFAVGVLSYLAYVILGVEYSIVLGLFAMVTNVIPFIGPFIGAAPAVIVAFFQEPILAIWVIIAIVIVQQIESNLISPNVMGKKLNVHPVTILFLLFIGGNLAGLVGMILIIPSYAVGKAIFQNIYRLIKLRYPEMR